MVRTRIVGWSGRAAALLLIAAASGCAGPPPPPPPTVVDITMQADPTANANLGGQGAPVALRIYQLGSQAGFSGAEFFPLYNSDAATLGSDLVKRDDFILAPGQTQTATIRPRDDVTTLGVFAAYRDFQHASWRATVAIPPHQTTKLAITARHDGIVIKAVTLPAKSGA